MKKKKKSLFEVESLAFPEYHSRSDSEEEQKPKESRHGGKHHLHSKNDAVAVPEVEVEDEQD